MDCIKRLHAGQTGKSNACGRGSLPTLFFSLTCTLHEQTGNGFYTQFLNLSKERQHGVSVILYWYPSQLLLPCLTLSTATVHSWQIFTIHLVIQNKDLLASGRKAAQNALPNTKATALVSLSRIQTHTTIHNISPEPPLQSHHASSAGPELDAETSRPLCACSERPRHGFQSNLTPSQRRKTEKNDFLAKGKTCDNMCDR